MAMKDRLERIEHLMGEVLGREEYYEAFLDASPWGILVVDDEFRIVYMNSTMRELSGYRLQEVEGEHLQILIPPEDREVHSRHERDYKTHPRVRFGDHPFEPKLLHRDGQLIDVEISLAPAMVHGEAYFYASIRERKTLPPHQNLEQMSPGPGEYDIDDIEGGSHAG